MNKVKQQKIDVNKLITQLEYEGNVDEFIKIYCDKLKENQYDNVNCKITEFKLEDRKGFTTIQKFIGRENLTTPDILKERIIVVDSFDILIFEIMNIEDYLNDGWIIVSSVIKSQIPGEDCECVGTEYIIQKEMTKEEFEFIKLNNTPYTEEEINQYKLYDYPEIQDWNKLPAVLSNSIKISNSIQFRFDKSKMEFQLS
jgi:hypothetical protein